MKKLKNYTTTISFTKSISEIEKMLVLNGATNISKEYVDGIPSKIIFMVLMNGESILFKLAPKISEIESFFKSQVKSPRKDTFAKITLKSRNIAWRILKDWVEIQMTMVNLEQASLAQLFLPYYYDINQNETMWDKLENNGIKALL